MLAGVLVFLYFRWPFTPERFERSLAQGTHSRVAIRQSSMFFFPSPGLILKDVEFRRGGQQAAPIATVRQIRAVGSWISLLTLQHRLSALETEGLVVDLPDQIPPPENNGTGKPLKTTVASVLLDGAVLKNSGLRFQFDRLRLRDAGPNEQIGFDAVLQNPSPRGRIAAQGSIGPWKDDMGSIRASGSFELTGADLAQYKDLAGVVQAKGKVTGALSGLKVDGTAAVSGFEVNHNGHAIDLRAAYSAVVNGLNGDTTLDSVNGHFLQTDLSAHGAVKASKGHDGKTVELDFYSRNARIQDLLLLATKAQPPALSGPITLRAHVAVPPEDMPFLKKVELRGDFRIPRARFNKAQTQEKVDELSARAEDGVQQDRVFSQLSGAVDLKHGIAQLHDCRFAVPGAVATGGGTYNVLTKVVNLDGTVEMKATVSEASTGLKSILLKPFNAAFRNRKQNAGAELPVHVVGQYPHPQFHVNLVGKKRRR